MAGPTPEQQARRKKFGEGLGKIGKALAGVGLPVLGTAVGGPVGGAVASSIVRALKLSPDAGEDEIEAAIVQADPSALVELRRMETDLALAQIQSVNAEGEQVTRRWEADAASDSLLAKNVRPALLALVVVCFLVFVFIAAFSGITPPEEITDAIRWLASAFVLSYVGGRTLEKSGRIIKGVTA